MVLETIFKPFQKSMLIFFFLNFIVSISTTKYWLYSQLIGSYETEMGFLKMKLPEYELL